MSRSTSLDEIPQGMVGKSIPAGTFVKYTAKGDLTQGAVYHEWTKIWNSDLKRKYTADFEVYGQKAQNPKNAEVDIYISIE